MFVVTNAPLSILLLLFFCGEDDDDDEDVRYVGDIEFCWNRQYREKEEKELLGNFFQLFVRK